MWWLGALPVAGVLYAAGGVTAQTAVVLVVAASAAAILLQAHRALLARVAAMLAVAAVPISL